ncbi:MAG: glycosyltransferase family 4 protein [Xanthomonadales bacterium]|nr:glycosyltransferase family 4 protein [Xanthomonadales bacterium]
MKIVYLHQYFNTPDMVGGTRSYELARRLVAKGHEVEMVTSWRERDDRRDWFTSNEAGIKVHWLPVPYGNQMSYRQRVAAFLRFAWGAARKAASLQADVVYATSTPLTIALPAVYAARRMRCPMVFEVRDLWPTVPIAVGALRNPLTIWSARKLERFAYRNATRVVALSPGMAEGVAAAGYSAANIRVIPNSADLKMFSHDDEGAQRFRAARPELDSRPIILYAGTFGLINGVEWVVRLAVESKLRALDCCFVLVGDGAEKEKVTRLARELGVLGNNCFIYESLPKSSIVDAFSASAVVVSTTIDLPELEANSANKFFDGLAAGKTVAVNYGGWQAELIEDYEVGMAWPREPSQAADVLADWFAQPDRLRVAGNNARQLAEGRFSRDLLAEQLERVLLEAV